jgi:hypothetical protein
VTNNSNFCQATNFVPAWYIKKQIALIPLPSSLDLPPYGSQPFQILFICLQNCPENEKLSPFYKEGIQKSPKIKLKFPEVSHFSNRAEIQTQACHMPQSDTTSDMRTWGRLWGPAEGLTSWTHDIAE